jgi:quercetin dioxygenase-like cupin family protein
MRRIVTGHAENGRAELASIGEVQRKEHLPNSKNEIHFCWGTPPSFTLPHSGGDVVASMETFLPPPGGTTFLVMHFAPHFESPLHATDTVDYCTVISGEIWLVMEDGEEERMGPGDCVVQNGTRHAWHNRTAETCVMSSVLVGATRRA